MELVNERFYKFFLSKKYNLAIQLDRLWAALKLGGLSLEVLRLGGCQCAQTKRKDSGKDSAQVARELFAALRELKELNLTGINMNAELLQGILTGLFFSEFTVSIDDFFRNFCKSKLA